MLGSFIAKGEKFRCEVTREGDSAIWEQRRASLLKVRGTSLTGDDGIISSAQGIDRAKMGCLYAISEGGHARATAGQICCGGKISGEGGQEAGKDSER
eukprot:5555012-Pleurochrysis_carterae.AAC.1